MDYTEIIKLPDCRSFPKYIKRNPDLTAYTKKIDFIVSITETELEANTNVFDITLLRNILTDFGKLSEGGVKLSKAKLITKLLSIKSEALETRKHIFREIIHLLEVEGYSGELLDKVITKQTTTTECFNFIVDSLVRTDESRKTILSSRFADFTIIKTYLVDIYKSLSESGRGDSQIIISKLKKFFTKLTIKCNHDSKITLVKIHTDGIVNIDINTLLDFYRKLDITKAKSQELVAYLSLMTGRRACEILWQYSTWRMGSNAFEIAFSGQAKSKGFDTSTVVYNIPVLDDLSRIFKALAMLKKMDKLCETHEEVSPKYGRSWSTNQSPRVKNIQQKCGIKMLKDYRGVYACYNAEQNCPQNQSYARYIAKILGHSELDIVTAQSYQKFTFSGVESPLEGLSQFERLCGLPVDDLPSMESFETYRDVTSAIVDVESFSGIVKSDFDAKPSSYNKARINTRIELAKRGEYTTETQT